MATQFSTTVSHCILAAPQFTYSVRMERRVSLHVPGVEPGISHMTGRDPSGHIVKFNSRKINLVQKFTKYNIVMM